MEKSKLYAVLMVGTFCVIVILIIAGILQRSLNLTAVALALVSYLGWLTKALLNIKDDPP